MFRWRYLDATGSDAGVSEVFPDREAAEAWLGTAWGELLGRDVDQVVLEDRARRPVYRMSLQPER